MQLSAKKILKIFEIIGNVEGSKEIADLLQTTHSAVEAWKRRDKIPDKYLSLFAQKYNIPTDFFAKNEEDIFCLHEKKVMELREEQDPIYHSFQRALIVSRMKSKEDEFENLLDKFYKENKNN